MLADVPPGPVLEPEVLRLEERRATAVKLWIEADLRGGRHLEVIPELWWLTRRYSFHQGFRTQLLSVLNRV